MSPPPAGSDAAGAARLVSNLIELGGAGLAVVELEGSRTSPADPTAGAVRVGAHRRGKRPHEGLDGFDLLLSAEPLAPRPWVSVLDLDAELARLADIAAGQAAASTVAAQVLRMTLSLSFGEALALESIAYSMLLGSAGFRRWRAEIPVRARPPEPGPRVRVETLESALTIRLTRERSRNAFDARMRDELCEALDFALGHPDAPPVTLCGEGPSFSAGGDLDEFGQADDPGLAHLVRTLRAPAAAVHALGPRVTARVHGPCVGAGIEVPAAAGRLLARPGARFRLPEVAMGLIPGAGGTASIPRRIGRHRAAYMAISGVEIDLPTALDWGLVDAEDGAP